MSDLSWKASERLVTTVFPYSHRAFDKVALQLADDEQPSVDEVRHLEDAHDWERLFPQLFIAVDVDVLISDTKLPPSAIAVSVVVRDRVLNKFEKIRQWHLNKLPDDMWSLENTVEEFSWSPRLDIAVIATPHEAIVNVDSVPIPKGALLATKVFKIRIPSSGLDFPIKFVEPDEMTNEGLFPNTVCYVRWKGVDPQSTPQDAIEIWLNKGLEDKFRSLNDMEKGTTADHISRTIAAQVYNEVFEHVLSSDEIPSEPTSLVSIVEELMQGRLNLTLEDARRIYRRGPDGRSRLTPWCWKLAGADHAFTHMKL